ncbi:MAG TPA: hypothetical protein VF773_18265 [Verrucomicrobiae bacterium]
MTTALIALLVLSTFTTLSILAAFVLNSRSYVVEGADESVEAVSPRERSVSVMPAFSH